MADFDWTRVRAFLASADAGSFSGAASVLRVSQPTVGRQVAALEAELDLVLFERAGRGLVLTAAGRQLVEHARDMARSADALSLAADGQAEALEGSVTISCSELVAFELLPAILAPVRRAHPGILIDLVTTNDVSDLARREADIAIRHVRPDTAELIGRKLRDSTAVMWASRAYLAAAGPFRRLEDLQHASFIGYDRSDRMIDTLASLGLPLTQAHFPMVTINSLVQRALAEQGLGICFLLDGLAGPALVPVLPERIALPVPMWLVCHRELRTSPRFRVVFDALATQL